METKLRKIGNSKGLILSKKILQDTNIKDRVKIKTKGSKIIIEAFKENPRKDWEQQLLEAGSLNDRKFFFGEIENNFDENEWTW
ncbi:AbrB/MazE/SpoVT family DNA-binding domain-containing protein [Ornithobacterium rhinotracheale]|uniref:AbrB/MazE/SpoVT family DNA-binding domain-containing protein n=1 Tax=Ornithobacterium rhinotracheale TaxID=28251 RepID=UPI00129C9B2C|nr:AbrB/MazE/SpoVT family DNA-binding domain-containing protein [Ornithobacterium rhinotracheale]MRI64202.1 AbrB/MazE/SpoVT family DNA-binding domain-containing protein [Ornithobacterium rhinotracheale]MRJ09687.1 AbrB/MazE/SpoVT family DNA-binding domain-containing protein [Ornithobacterium rhinotracheale]